LYTYPPVPMRYIARLEEVMHELAWILRHRADAESGVPSTTVAVMEKSTICTGRVDVRSVLMSGSLASP
jgi:hypothetical protein